MLKFLKKAYNYFLIVGLIFTVFFIGLKNFLILLSCIVVASTISVILHELGHYTVSCILGNKPKYFIVGTTLFGLNKLNGLIKFKINKTRFYINPFAQSGSVESFTYMNTIKEWKMIAISVAGPIVNLFSAILILSFEVNFIQECLNHKLTLTFEETVHVFFIFGLVLCNIIYFIGNLTNLTSSDGWFANQLIQKFDDRDILFFDYKIHQEHDRKLIDKNSYNDFLEPLYNNFEQSYEYKESVDDICVCSERKYYYFSFMTIILGIALLLTSIILDCIPSLSYEMSYVQRSGGLLIVLGIFIQFFLLAIRRRVIQDNVILTECGPEESKTYKWLNIVSYIFMIVGTLISSYYDLLSHIYNVIAEILKYI